MKELSLYLVLFMLAGCQEESRIIFAGQPEHTESFVQPSAPKLDVLWVVDDSASMAAEQNKVAAQASQFFGRLLEASADLHVGVITTDPAQGGALRRFSGAVTGCDRCRFISPAVPCDNPNDPGQCEALALFQQLVVVGTAGSALERPFEQVQLALGLTLLDEQTQTPQLDVESGRPILAPPEQNAGFIRDDADLLLIFVSDEDEGLGAAAPPVRYYERLFASVKSGTAHRVLVAAIAGWPAEGALSGSADNICDVASAIRAPEQKERIDAIRGESCADPTDPSRDRFASSGLRYAELTCRLGGVFARICSGDYVDALQEVSDRAIRFATSFRLRYGADLDRGEDCIPFSGDEARLDCDSDGSTDSQLDGPVCVSVVRPQMPTVLLPQDPQNGWSWDEFNSAITFEGAYRPQSGESVSVRYKLLQGRSSCGS